MTDKQTSPIGGPQEALFSEENLPSVRKTKASYVLAPVSLSRELDEFKKSVESVMVKPHKGKLGALHRKCFNVMVAMAQRSTKTAAGYYEVRLSDFTKLLDYRSRNTAYLQEILTHLVATPVEWEAITEKGGKESAKWSVTALLSYASIERGVTGGTTITYDFHREFEPLLLAPGQWAYLSLQIMANCRTHPAIVLYEIGIRYQTNPGKLTNKLPWQQFAAVIMGVPSVSPDLQYKYFVRDVLKPALQEVNLVQDQFVMEAVPHLLGRKVELLQFRITTLKKVEAPPRLGTADGPEFSVEQLRMLGEMQKMGINQKTGENILIAYPALEVANALETLKRRVVNPGQSRILNTAAYLKRMLDGLPEPKTVATDASIKKETARRPGAVKGPEVSLQGLYKKNRMTELLDEFYDFPDEVKFAIVDKFEEEKLPSLNKTMQKAWADGKKKETFYKKVPAMVAVDFKEWLFNESAADAEMLADSERLTQWHDAQRQSDANTPGET
ncbi:replication initiation protein [Nostoc sp. CHAB 5834]|nr:replication initiation protein [Nostoc sp. CHAB 5834]